MFTVKNLAERVGRAEGRTPQSIEFLHRQFRNLALWRVLTPIGKQGEGRTAASLFGKEALAVSKLCAVMLRSGNDGTRLRAVAEALAVAGFDSARTDAPKDLAGVVEETRAGQHLWWLTLARNYSAGTGATVVATFTDTPPVLKNADEFVLTLAQRGEADFDAAEAFEVFPLHLIWAGLIPAEEA